MYSFQQTKRFSLVVYYLMDTWVVTERQVRAPVDSDAWLSFSRSSVLLSVDDATAALLFIATHCCIYGTVTRFLRGAVPLARLRSAAGTG